MLWVFLILSSLLSCYFMKVRFKGESSKIVCAGFSLLQLIILYLFAEMFQLNTLLHKSATRLALVWCQKKCANFLLQVAKVWDISRDAFNCSRDYFSQIWQFKKHVSHFIYRCLCQNRQKISLGWSGGNSINVRHGW